MPRRKPTAAKAPRVVPELRACPSCGVELEAGAGTNGLAWHGCKKASIMDEVERAVCEGMKVAAEGEATVAELIALLTAVREHRASTGSGPAGEVADWLQRRG